MANRGDNSILRPSPQDKLAACIVYSPDTHPGNTFPDTNQSYGAPATAGATLEIARYGRLIAGPR